MRSRQTEGGISAGSPGRRKSITPPARRAAQSTRDALPGGVFGIVDGGEGNSPAIEFEEPSREPPLRDLLTALHLAEIGRIAVDVGRDFREP